ncbi:TPA: hypothetical protein RVD86_004590 [Escherichia coli]|uniref:hypothetical protein n=1 Tax=Escherichia coli TaxID=562 RepID=UPI0028DF552D|nr:hypothetical protein [Escherichia coli]MDN2572333.1 hypothetical protein [Escherichia coli]HEA1118338.1 hypothetical protein [Escherichia coli]
MLILVNKRIPLGDGNVAVKTTYFPEKDKKKSSTQSLGLKSKSLHAEIKNAATIHYYLSTEKMKNAY